MIEFMEDEKFKEFLKNKNCRGCFNKCVLTNPICNRSKIFIKDAYEEYLEKNNK
ncbi:MAG: hypothetical protein IKM97_03255 [Clostridia bacterium]|nr:hypothetical protein [Clostridia bacterium]